MTVSTINPSFAFVHIRRLAVDVSVGVYAHEHFLRSVFVSLTVEIPANLAAPKNDDLCEVLDYDSLVDRVRRACAQSEHVHLLETLCQRIADECLQIPEVQGITVAIEKAKAMEGVESVVVEISRRKK